MSQESVTNTLDVLPITKTQQLLLKQSKDNSTFFHDSHHSKRNKAKLENKIRKPEQTILSHEEHTSTAKKNSSDSTVFLESCRHNEQTNLGPTMKEEIKECNKTNFTTEENITTEKRMTVQKQDENPVILEISSDHLKPSSGQLKPIKNSNKSKNKCKNIKKEKAGHLYPSDHKYITQTNDTCETICRNFWIEGGPERLAFLNSPYNGVTLTTRHKFKKWTVLRVNDQIPNPGAISSDEDEVSDDDINEVVCSFCISGDEVKGNKIVLCDGPNCPIALHQHCHGPLQIPEKEYYCEACEAKKFVNENKRPVHCAVCGSFSAQYPWTLRSGRWIHINCLGKPIKATGKRGRKGGKGEKDIVKVVKQKVLASMCPTDNDNDDDNDIDHDDGREKTTTYRGDIRDDIWTTIMGNKLEGKCCVCAVGIVRKDKGKGKVLYIIIRFI